MPRWPEGARARRTVSLRKQDIIKDFQPQYSQKSQHPIKTLPFEGCESVCPLKSESDAQKVDCVNQPGWRIAQRCQSHNWESKFWQTTTHITYFNWDSNTTCILFSLWISVPSIPAKVGSAARRLSEIRIWFWYDNKNKTLNVSNIEIKERSCGGRSE